MQWLQEWDLWLLMKINRDWATPALDPFFTTITDLHKNKFFVFIGVPLLLIALCWRKNKKEILLILSTTILAVVLSDVFCGQVLKNLVERSRPPLQSPEVIVRVPLYGNRSFPSNHAANMFALATMIAFWRPRWRWWAFAGAGLIAYSRSYVGLHFPSDWLAGAVIGVLIANLIILLRKRIPW